MDVKLPTQSAWLYSLVLAILLGNASQVIADEAIASDGEASSTIFISDDAFISDDSASEPPSLLQTAETSPLETSAAGSIVFIEDTSVQAAVSSAPINPAQINLAPISQAPVARSTINRVAVAPNPSVAHGELKVVANRQRQVATLQPIAKPVKRELPGDIQIAVHTEPLVLESATPDKMNGPKSVATSAAKLLIAAHKLSLEAKTTADYSQIVQDCAQALGHGAKGDQRGFARQLSSWALNRRGQLRADEGEQDLANADFQAALDSNPRNWRAMHNRGVTFAQTGKFAEAFDDFNGVIQLNPKYAKAYANRATLYVQAKDLQAAIKDYENAIQIDHTFATAHVGLGRVCHMLSRWDEAIDHYTTAAELEPSSADIICSRGDLQADMGNYGEALADYARTIELDPEFAHAYRNGAWLLATCPDERFRDPENAVLGAEQALECSYGERHIALDTLAAALASDGQFEEAVATVTKAVDLAPEGAKFTYLSRLQLYQDSQPFRTEPHGEVAQAGYEGE